MINKNQNGLKIVELNFLMCIMYKTCYQKNQTSVTFQLTKKYLYAEELLTKNTV